MKLPFIVPVNGVSYRQGTVRTVAVGDVVEVVHEPGNPADPNAFAVRTGHGDPLGFVPASVAARLIVDFGAGATFTGTVLEVLGSTTVGLRVRVHAEGLPGEGPAPASEPACADAGAAVTTRTGRPLGTLVDRDGTHLIVAAGDGTTRRYPSGSVTVAA